LFHGWRGGAQDLATVSRERERAASRGDVAGIVMADHAHAVLLNALGRHDEALAACQRSGGARASLAGNWCLAELVESASRVGRMDLAMDALLELRRRTGPSGSTWAEGVRARTAALVSDGAGAENEYRRAIGHLGMAGTGADLARAHLLYGEWLSRNERRHDARQELTTAHDLLAAMGATGFAARARRELSKVGASMRMAGAMGREPLTEQEQHIAQLARDGLSNPEIGAALFLSSRTVEWHLSKVFSKLGITSRRDLRRVVGAPARDTVRLP
jgi:ATP/maltotriose-dependent transcriptional regulator MalT